MGAPATGAPFVVASEDTLNRFEALYVDEHTDDRCTVSFFVREPVLYHPAHQARPSFTHISYIAKDYFVVGASTTERMIPIRRTQQVLFKLSPDDIEREIEGNQLDPGERCIWRRWADADALRRNRKSRIRAPCCGRFACPYQLVQDGDGLLRCNKCRTEPWPAWSVSKQLEQPMPQLAQGTQLVEPTPEVAPWQQAQPMPQFKQEKQDSGAAMPTPRLTAMGVVPNPNEAPADKPVLPPWRKRKADGEEIAPPPKSMRKSNGGLETWHAHENCGWAWFTGYDQWVFVHLSDIDSPPQAGDALTGRVRMMSGGKLQAFDVKRIVENREGGLNASLGHGQLEQTPVQGTEPHTQPAVQLARQDEQQTGWQQTAAWPHAPTTYAHEVLPQRPVVYTQLAAPSSHQDDPQAVTKQPAVHAQLEVQSEAVQRQDGQVLGMYAQQQSPVPQAATLAQREECEIPDSSQDSAEQSPSQTSMPPADYGVPPPPPLSALPTPVGLPAALGPNPQEVPAIAAQTPPRLHQTVDAPPLRRRKPGVLELWHPYKEGACLLSHLNLGGPPNRPFKAVGLCRVL